MRSTEITAKDNARIKRYCRLRDSAHERRAEGMFVMEGARLVGDAIKEGADIEEAFYTRSAQEKYAKIVDKLKQIPGITLNEVSEEVAIKLSDTRTPQGIFAVFKSLDKSGKSVTIKSNGKYLILNNLQDPGNIGTILRSADAVGVDGVYICGGCDIYNPKLIRATMGSLFRVKTDCDKSYEQVISELRKSGIKTCAAVLDKDAESVREFDFSGGCAAVIGNEGNGLKKEEADLCDKRITIRMKGTVESLNAATAASIILWELMKGE